MAGMKKDDFDGSPDNLRDEIQEHLADILEGSPKYTREAELRR